MAAAEQVLGWLRGVAVERSGRTVAVPGGVAVLHDSYPAAHDHNRLILWTPVDGETAAASADEVLAGAGLDHRRIDVADRAVADAAGPGLGAAGYERTDELVLVHDGRAPVPAAASGLVVALDLDQRAQAATASWQAERPDWDAEVGRQLGERIRTIETAVEPTFLAVVEGGDVLARVDVYRRDGVAQIEELVTEPAGQKRGYAGALVAEAIRRAQAAGSETVFLVADADDWPVQWYRRIGFGDLAAMASFTR